MAKLPPNILKTASKGKHTEDGGLQLRITSVAEDGTRKGSWYFRYSFQGKQQEFGLGSISKLNLKQARLERDRYADGMADRRDPVNPKDAKRQERDQGKAGRWLSPLTLHVLPKLGRKDVTEITQQDISKALLPIWIGKSTHSKKGYRALGYCTASCARYRVGCNPFGRG